MTTEEQITEAAECAALGNTVIIYTRNPGLTIDALENKGHKPSFKKPIWVFNIAKGQVRVTQPGDAHLNDHCLIGHWIIDDSVTETQKDHLITHHMTRNQIVHPYT